MLDNELLESIYNGLKSTDKDEIVNDCWHEAEADVSVEALIEGFTDADLEANLRIAHALGKIGQPALAVLKDKFRTDPDPYIRALALFALSKKGF